MHLSGATANSLGQQLELRTTSTESELEATLVRGKHFKCSLPRKTRPVGDVRELPPADVRPLIGEAVTRGGHVRVGLEDTPLGTPTSNRALVEEAMRSVRHYGAEPAPSADMRHALGSIGGGG